MSSNFVHRECADDVKHLCIICSKINWDKIDDAEKRLEEGGGVLYEVKNGDLVKVETDNDQGTTGKR